MTPAESAVNNAISFECKKDALQQRQSGDWKISFTVQGLDMDERITRAPMGTRFVAVLVAINDDELPIPLAEKEKGKSTNQTAPKLQPDTSDKARPAGVGREKRDWNEMQPAQQAGILINDPIFASYLIDRHFVEWRETGDADNCIKHMCGVTRKRDIAGNHKALVLWHQIVADYRTWCLAERVGA